jgi:hypothetical protein
MEVKENWSWVPDGGLIPRENGRLTVGLKITLTILGKAKGVLFLFNYARHEGVCRVDVCLTSAIVGVELSASFLRTL